MSATVVSAIEEMRAQLQAQRENYGELSLRFIRNDVSKSLDIDDGHMLSKHLYVTSEKLWGNRVIGISPPTYLAACELLDEAARQARARP